MSGLYTDAFVETLSHHLQQALGQWPDQDDGWSLELLNLSENATFLVQSAIGQRRILRVHRPNYHCLQEVLSELSWIEALQAETDLRFARVVPNRDGDYVVQLDLPSGSVMIVAFDWLEGREPAPSDDLEADFLQLGEITAALHEHAQNWQRPLSFRRKTWNYEATISSRALWGDWRQNAKLTSEGRELLEAACQKILARLEAFGATPDRFGLIHADLRLANLLVHDGEIGVIDFDDAGFGWFGFDFAATVSFIETDPRISTLQQAWCDGYRKCRALSPEAEAMLPVFVMMRRLQLTAWLESHSDASILSELPGCYLEGSLALAEGFLSGTGVFTAQK
ncbi:MAG: phosphotransferase enzyme family protein [Mangrovicoccus sp.]